MGISPYAAIVIGSKNMLMKVYEISGGKGFRTVDEIRYEYELGKEAYFTRKITFAQIEEICNVLMEFQQRMREYAITEFRCYATRIRYRFLIRLKFAQVWMLSCSAIRNFVSLCIREFRY